MECYFNFFLFSKNIHNFLNLYLYKNYILVVNGNSESLRITVTLIKMTWKIDLNCYFSLSRIQKSRFALDKYQFVFIFLIAHILDLLKPSIAFLYYIHRAHSNRTQLLIIIYLTIIYFSPQTHIQLSLYIYILKLLIFTTDKQQPTSR